MFTFYESKSMNQSKSIKKEQIKQIYKSFICIKWLKFSGRITIIKYKQTNNNKTKSSNRKANKT